MTLPLSRTVAIARYNSAIVRRALRRGGGSLALVLLLSSCGQLPWRAESSLRPVARRRAVPTSQRQEARMARPAAVGSRPLVDYGGYKRIHPGMELSEVQSLLGHEGQRDEVVVETDNSPVEGLAGSSPVVEELTVEGRDGESEMFWRWTHPSGVYNIHARLTGSSQPETWAVQSKWLTYNPPE